MPALRILIADDSEILRKALKCLLLQHSEKWLVCAEAIDGPDAIRKAGEVKPDVVLLDLSIPLVHGLDTAEVIQREFPHLKVIIMSEQDVSVLARLAKTRGIKHFVAKSQLAQDLIPALSRIAREIEAKHP